MCHVFAAHYVYLQSTYVSKGRLWQQPCKVSRYSCAHFTERKTKADRGKIWPGDVLSHRNYNNSVVVLGICINQSINWIKPGSHCILKSTEDLLSLSPVGTDGGNYDFVDDMPSPAAGDCLPRQSSARHNWEMNYQEAAIYLQVGPLACRMVHTRHAHAAHDGREAVW